MSEGFDTPDESSADTMTAPDALSVAPRIRPLQGRAFVQEIRRKASSILHVPAGNPRDEKVHYGRVLALGEPGTLEAKAGSPVVPWGCKVGDVIVFSLAVWMDKMRRDLHFPGVDGEVCVVAQVEILGVEEQDVHERPTLTELP